MRHGALSPACPIVERASYLPVLPFLPTGRGGALIPSDLLPSTLRGFFRAGAAIRLIEPLDGGSEGGQHALYEAQHLRQKAWTCGVSNTSLESILGPRTSAAVRPRVRSPHPASSLPPRLPVYSGAEGLALPSSCRDSFLVCTGTSWTGPPHTELPGRVQALGP